MNREEAYAALDDLYAQLPALECRGLCHAACTVIDASELERQRVAEHGVTLPRVIYSIQRNHFNGTERCPALGPLNNCRVYKVRPFICRAFGMVLNNPADPHSGPLMCDHGCIPEGVLDVAEFARLLLAIEKLSAQVTGKNRRPW